MRILVTGGLGTVGAGVIKELRARGHHVVSCDLYHQPDEIGFSLRTDVKVPLYARCDVGEFQQLERVFDRMGPFDYVYHCAAEFGRWNGIRREIRWHAKNVAPKAGPGKVECEWRVAIPVWRIGLIRLDIATAR